MKQDKEVCLSQKKKQLTSTDNYHLSLVRKLLEPIRLPQLNFIQI